MHDRKDSCGGSIMVRFICILRELIRPFTLLALRQERLLGLVTIRRHMDRGSGRCLAEFQEDEKERPSENSLLSAMGWVVIIAFKPLLHVFRETGSMDVLYWLIGGGLFDTVGCLFFFLDKYKYMHPVWHFFVLGGSICHFISIYLLV